MRRTILLLVIMSLTLLLASGVALAATILGTDQSETLIGTRYADYIRAEGGNDVVRGLGGPDQLNGKTGEDRVVGGDGDDNLYGGTGNDRLYSEDIFSQGGAYRDVVDCGPGEDFAYVDWRDVVRENCEGVVTVIT